MSPTHYCPVCRHPVLSSVDGFCGDECRNRVALPNATAPAERPAPPKAISDETIRKWRDPSVPALPPPTAAERARTPAPDDYGLPAGELERRIEALQRGEGVPHAEAMASLRTPATTAEHGNCERCGAPMFRANSGAYRGLLCCTKFCRQFDPDAPQPPATTAPSGCSDCGEGLLSTCAECGAEWELKRPGVEPAEPSADAASVKRLAEIAILQAQRGDGLVDRHATIAALRAAIDQLAAEHREARNEARVLRDAIDRQAARAQIAPAATAKPPAVALGAEDARYTLALVALDTERQEKGRLRDAMIEAQRERDSQRTAHARTCGLLMVAEAEVVALCADRDEARAAHAVACNEIDRLRVEAESLDVTIAQLRFDAAAARQPAATYPGCSVCGADIAQVGGIRCEAHLDSGGPVDARAALADERAMIQERHAEASR